MKEKIAFSILNINRKYTEPCLTVKDYHRCIERYYLSQNPAADYMLPLINKAYETVKDYAGAVEPRIGYCSLCYGEEINTALNAIISLNLAIEVCGVWVWVEGATDKQGESLHEAGFNFAPGKKLWYYCPEESEYEKDKPWTMEQIRAKYGSNKPNATDQLSTHIH